MCTVSFIATNKQLILTSNRDELSSRAASLRLVETVANDIKMVYPKDPKAGGTWFVANENGIVGILLNGAFKKHHSKGDYAKSRGLVLLEVVGRKQSTSFLRKTDLTHIEPFTLILYEAGTLLEFRWDGLKKYFKVLPVNTHHIWSSATLYSDAVIRKRQEHFSEFLANSNDLRANAILDFHSENKGDLENGFIIERANGLRTLSVTQAIIKEDAIQLCHLDLLKNQKDTAHISTVTVANHEL